jgi:hypothetical protein
MAPGGSSMSEARRDPPHLADPPRRSEERATPPRHLFDGSDRLDSDSLQRCPSRVRSTGSASKLSAPQEADSGTAPRRLQSLIIRGCVAPDVQVSLAAGRGQGSTSAMAEVGRTAPRQPGECSAAIGATDRSGVAPRVSGHQARSPRAGLISLPGEEVPGSLQDVSSRSQSHRCEPFDLFAR